MSRYIILVYRDKEVIGVFSVKTKRPLLTGFIQMKLMECINEVKRRNMSKYVSRLDIEEAIVMLRKTLDATVERIDGVVEVYV